MVVDDEKKIADLYSIILRSAGFSVDRIVYDGAESVNAVKSNPGNYPDVILMDQKMPRMDGLEASRKIKEINSDIKIIMITAYDVPQDSKKFLSLILAKPISKHQLLEAIRTRLNQALSQLIYMKLTILVSINLEVLVPLLVTIDVPFRVTSSAIVVNQDTTFTKRLSRIDVPVMSTRTFSNLFIIPVGYLCRSDTFVRPAEV